MIGKNAFDRYDIGMVFLQYGFEHDLVAEKIGNNFVYISDIGMVSLQCEF